MYVSEKNIKMYYQEQLPTIQTVHKQDTTAPDLSKVSTTILFQLKWLIEKLMPKGKLRLCQLAGIDSAEIVVIFY